MWYRETRRMVYLKNAAILEHVETTAYTTKEEAVPADAELLPFYENLYYKGEYYYEVYESE